MNACKEEMPLIICSMEGEEEQNWKLQYNI